MLFLSGFLNQLPLIILLFPSSAQSGINVFVLLHGEEHAKKSLMGTTVRCEWTLFQYQGCKFPMAIFLTRNGTRNFVFQKTVAKFSFLLFSPDRFIIIEWHAVKQALQQVGFMEMNLSVNVMFRLRCRTRVSSDFCVLEASAVLENLNEEIAL